MSLMPMARAAILEDTEESVLFAMTDGARTVDVLVSRHALEHIDAIPSGNEIIERFNEYRAQFEEIASDKYARGHIERDGTICIRSRDLPGSGQ